MSEGFDYEEVFMGVNEGKPKSYRRSFKEDYRIKRLVEAVTIKKGKMLDIGCGGGVIVEGLHYFFPKGELYGCDTSVSAIKYAKKFGSGRVKYGVIKGKKLPYKDNFFDVCVCLDVMEHVPDVHFFLREVKRILKKDGQFFLLVPCEGQPFTFTWLFQKMKIGNKLTLKNWGHIHPEFTHEYVASLLKKHGFLVKRRTYSQHVLYQLSDLLLYFIPLELMNFFLGKKSVNYLDRGVVNAKATGKERKDFMMIVRNAWLHFGKALRFLTAWELEFFKKVPFTAWKAHFLAINEGK